MTTSDWISLGSAIISGLGLVGTCVGLWFTYMQWQKVKAKIGMIDDYGKAAEILPAWYTGRMMSDWWLFALFTNDGRVIIIRQIEAISDDGKWMDVELADSETGARYDSIYPNAIYAHADDRPKASIQIANIVAALDLQTS